MFDCYRRIFFGCLMLFSVIANASSNSNTSNAVAASLPIVAAVYTASIGDIEGFQELTISVLVTAQLTALLKNSVMRQRPNGGNNQSFPSGHAAAAFVAASYMESRYGLAWGLPLYAVACVISVQRVNVDAHYWTDVIAGAALGWGAAKYFTICYPNVKVEPHVDLDRRSVGIKVQASYQ